MELSAFPKIFAIGAPQIPMLFDDPVEITEKVDGSQFVFGKVDGELKFRSKGAKIYREDPQKMFVGGVEYICSIENKLPDNVIYYSEYLQKPKHNVLTYNRIPKNHIALFGISSPEKVFVDDYATLWDSANRLGIDVVPIIYHGKVTDIESFKHVLDQESFLGGPKIEGVVVKNYNQPYLLGGQPMPLMAGKYVSEAFKEVHRKRWSKDHTGRGKWDQFKENYRTEARWNKAVQHLKERGELEGSPRDIGKLIVEVKKDISEEEKEQIKEFLWKEFGEELLRGCTKGLPEWYKNQLLCDAFKETSCGC